MHKTFLIVSFFLFFLFPSNTFAQDPNFDITINSSYDVHENLVTTITQNVTIANKTEYNYTPSFSISVGFSNIENIVAFGEDGSIPFTLDDNDVENKNLKLKFEKRYAGIGTTNNFTIKFDTSDIATKRGNVWEVSIPGVTDPSDFYEYNTQIRVPESFGKAKIIKPKTKSDTLSFTKEETGKAGIYLIFGEKQYYKFKLSYHISNPNFFPVKTEIALPSDTNYQKVIISKFSKKAENVVKDFDGNWVAEYKLFPQQRETIVVEGYIEVNPTPEESALSSNDFRKYLTPMEYWDIDKKVYEELSGELSTPEDIYNFVTKTLTYNFDKVTGNNKRLGALLALETPENSVCLEFTDLFVALARASGIPARAVEGYAYTDNSTLRPLSLVEDVLHSWPEYYDLDQKRWIMVDPTWGNTTKGMDYFSSLDFEHIAFVIKGVDSTYPIPAGGYKFDKKSKDVEIGFAEKNDFKINPSLKISDTFPNFIFPNFKIEGSFVIENSGNSMNESTTAVVTTDLGEVREYKIESLPPGGKKTITLSFDKGPFLTNGDRALKIQVGNTSYSKKIKISFIPEIKSLLIVGGVILGSITITIITYFTGSLFIQRRKRENSLRGKSQRHQKKS